MYFTQNSFCWSWFALICAGPSPKHPSRGHIVLAVVVIIVGIAMGAVIAFFLFRKSGHRVPIPDTLTNFANPLFFSNDQSQADVADTKKLVENEEEKNPEPIITHLHDKCF